MQVYKITHRDIPGHLSVFAESDEQADAIFIDWFHARFDRSPMKFMVEDISAALRLSSKLHEAAQYCMQPGVAYATKDHGWVILPPLIEAPGPYHVTTKAVVCYEFIHAEDGSRVTVLAQNPGDAWHIYHLWAQHRYPGESDILVDLEQSDSALLDEPRIVEAVRSGITGVVSRRLSGWDVLPPWDEAAGDN